MGKFWDRFKSTPAPAPVEVETAEEVKPEVNAVIDVKPVELATDGTLKPNCTVSPYRKMSKSLTEQYNPPMAIEVFSHLYPTKKSQHVYLFNLSAQEFRTSRPPLFRELIIPGVKDGQEYAAAFSLPQPLPIQRPNIDSFITETVWEDARRVAMDIVNPDNLGVDPKKIKAQYSTSYGNDLSVRGVFWSMHAKPTKTEIKVARKRMEAHYRGLLEQIWALLAAGEVFLKGTITPEHHFAADYFKQDLPWHPRRPDTKAVAKKTTQGA